MNLNKVCSCCKTNLTTKNTISLGISDLAGRPILWLNCKQCMSTQTFYKKPTKTEMDEIMRELDSVIAKKLA